MRRLPDRADPELLSTSTLAAARVLSFGAPRLQYPSRVLVFRLPWLRSCVPEGRGAPEETNMATASVAELTRKHCVPCEGGIPPLSAEQVRSFLASLPAWKLTSDGQRIRREWRAKDFLVALDFFNRVGKLAEEEDHHPDLHLVGYRNVAIEISTHAIGGLSENDFILAAKIEQLPIELKK